MNNLPDTIYNKEKFTSSPPAGYDGVFDWSWTQGCFGDTKITPMDIDGIVERHGHFIVFETKSVGVPVPKGQQITLDSLVKTKKFTVMIIWGKREPEEYKIIHCNGEIENGFGVDSARQRVKDWYEYADNN